VVWSLFRDGTCTGQGSLSLDALLREAMSGPLWGLTALVAVLGGVISLLQRRPVPLERKHLRLMLWKNTSSEFKGGKRK